MSNFIVTGDIFMFVCISINFLWSLWERERERDWGREEGEGESEREGERYWTMTQSISYVQRKKNSAKAKERYKRTYILLS